MASFGTITTDSVRSDGGTFACDNDGDATLIVHLLVWNIETQTPTCEWDGTAMTLVRNTQDAANVNCVRTFKLLTPATTGTANIVIAGLTNKRHRIIFVPTNGTGDVTDDDGIVTAGATSLSVTMTTVSGDLATIGACVTHSTDPTMVATGDATQSAEGAVAAASTSGWGWGGTFVGDDTSADLGVSWTGSVAGALNGLVLEQSGGGGGGLSIPIATYYHQHLHS